MDLIARLKKFRQTAYKCLCKAKNATFELMDAVLLTRNAYSLIDLSLCLVFRRKWRGIYEALQDTRLQRQKLMRVYIEQIPSNRRIILAAYSLVTTKCWYIKGTNIRALHQRWFKQPPSHDWATTLSAVLSTPLFGSDRFTLISKDLFYFS